ncbi:MAG: M48 family metallopeptidase [Cellvibrionaceae bacterium]
MVLTTVTTKKPRPQRLDGYNAKMSLFPKRRKRQVSPRLIPIAAMDDLGFDYVIRLSSRKSASIEIRATEVRVSAPHRATQRELKHWVAEKAPWIRSKLAEQQRRVQQIPQRSFAHNEDWPFMGRSITLNIECGSKSQTQLVDDRLIITLSNRSQKPQSTQVATALKNWYQRQAQTILSQKALAVSERLKAPIRSIKLRRTKSKWGHCTIQGDLQFNWLIMQAPEAVIDYLVVHECCHLIHHNHSRQYWQLVESLSPDYQTAKRWLSEQGHRLVL